MESFIINPPRPEVWEVDEIMKKLKVGDKVEVKWVSAGIYAGERGSFIIVCGTYCPTKVLSHSPFGHPNWIPKGSIKSIRKLN